MSALLLFGNGEYTYDLHHIIQKVVDTPLYKGVLVRPGEQFYNSKDDSRTVQIYDNKFQLVEDGKVLVKGTIDKTSEGQLIFRDANNKALLAVNPFGVGRMTDYYLQLHKVWEFGPGTGFSPSY